MSAELKIDAKLATKIDLEVDARRLNCPLPILKAKKALTAMTSGQVLRVIATDKGSLQDFQAFASMTGNDLLKQISVGEEYWHTLRRR